MQTESRPGSQSKPDVPTDDLLAEIDSLMQTRVDEERESTARGAQMLADRSEFSALFDKVCDETVRPSMEAVIDRLRRNGGGGTIEELPEDEIRRRGHRLTLWMSLEGEISGSPRQDRNPYLQLDADVDKRTVAVSEGDMWQGSGGNRSGKAAEWTLSEITSQLVTTEAVAILRRSSRRGSA